MASYYDGGASRHIGQAVVLLITRNEALETLIRKALYGMNCQLAAVRSVSSAYSVAQQHMPAVVLIDRQVKENLDLRAHPSFRDVPVLSVESPDKVVTEDECVAELDAGLDGCLCNQTARQIVARIRSILRRRPSAQDANSAFHCGPLHMDVARHEVRVGTRPVVLTPREFQILRQFLESPGLVLSRQELLNRVWGEDFALEEHALDVHIHALRQKIEANPSRPALILTIRGVGYKLAAQG